MRRRPAAREQFLFIPDLTAKATGWVLAVLIVMYICSQLLSSLLTPSTADRNQKMIMYGLPFVFVFFVINFPAGLIVYWITTNLWTVGQGYVLRRSMGPISAPKDAGETFAGIPSRASPTGGAAASWRGWRRSRARRPRSGGEPRRRPAKRREAGAGEGQGAPARHRRGAGAGAKSGGRAARRRRHPAPRSRGQACAQRPAAAAAAQEEEALGEAALMADDDELDPVEAVEELLEEVVRALGLDATVEVDRGRRHA